MGTNNKSIGKLLEHIDNSELVLPEIQRDFIWDKKSVLMLLDSLYRRLPIGYMLVWKAKKAVAQKNFKRVVKKRIGQSIDGFYGYLLDGQQRLTAIQLVRDSADEYPLMFSLRPIDAKDPDSGRFSYRARWNSNAWHIPVSDIISKQLSPINIVDNLRSEADFDYNRDANNVIADVTKLQNILDYSVGLIEFEDDNYHKATELFIRFNSTGKKLKSSDLVAAELALTVPNLVSNSITKVSSSFSSRYNFNFTKPFLIQCLAAIHTHKIDFKKSTEVWTSYSEKQIHNSWKKTEKGLSRAIEFITGTVKWDSDTWLPSINSLIPLIYMLSNDKFTHDDRMLARKWLLQASVYAAFSGSVYSELDRIIRGIKNEPNISKLISLTKRSTGKILPEHFETSRKSGPAIALFISLLRNRNAKNWINRTPLDGSVMGHNAELQIHHFFSRALLSKHGYDSEAINTFANYTIISKDTNLDISDMEPIQYIETYGIRKQDLILQCIPQDKELWKVKNYKYFLGERRKLLARTCNTFLDSK